MDDIIKILNKEVLTTEEEIRALSVELRNLKHVYDALIPNKKKTNIIKTDKLKDQETFYEFIELLSIYNKVLYNKLANTNNDIKKIEKKFLHYHESLEWNMALKKSDLFLQYKEINEKMRNILSLGFNYIVDLYESLEQEKEEKKEHKKRALYALKKIKHNESLNFSDINIITLLIEKEEDLDKEKLFNELNNYIESKKNSKIKPKVEESTEEEKKNYVDDKKMVITEEKKDKKNPIIFNYLATIKSFGSNKSAIKEFLNAVSYNDDIEDIISEMLLEIDADKEQELYDVVSNYLIKMSNDEFEEDKTTKDEQINLLFYDFMNNPDKMISIIDKNIPKEDYKSLLKAMELLKKDGAVANRTTTVLLKKIYKLRVDKVRVTFKRLNHNTYIVLGIFRKKDQHGSEVIAKTKSRNDKLSRYEKSIIESADIPEIWNSYLEINEEIYTNVIEKIKLDKNNKYSKSC